MNPSDATGPGASGRGDPPVAGAGDHSGTAAGALHADVVATLRAWPAPDHHQAVLREAYLALLLARDDACRRTCTPGHITASTVVLDAAHRHTLLTLHPRAGRWCQLGGHLEPDDASVADAGLREATEESGIEGLWFDRVPLSLDVHPITCKGSPPTRHFDVRFVAVAPEGARPVISDESDDLRYWPVDALPAGVDDSLREAVAAALARVALRAG